MVAGSSPLAVGAPISRGARVGDVGSTGYSTGAHLHLTIGTSITNPNQGAVIDPVPFIRARETTSSPNPADPIPNLAGDKMIRIQAPNRGIALIGAGYYRHLANQEEVDNAAAIMEKHLSGNDRQFDLWVSMALNGVAAKPQA